eukprot:1196277-Alexandrium_andersonii.AAC.1
MQLPPPLRRLRRQRRPKRRRQKARAAVRKVVRAAASEAEGAVTGARPMEARAEADRPERDGCSSLT